MKKIYCYSKKELIFEIPFLMVVVVLALLPIFVFKNDLLVYKLLFSVLMTFFAVLLVVDIFYGLQYVLIDGEYIILRNPFGVLQKLKVKDCYFEITNLPVYTGRKYVDEKWICIYLKRNKCKDRFKKGYTNGKKFNRIQLLCNKQNLEYIQMYFENADDILDI